MGMSDCSCCHAGSRHTRRCVNTLSFREYTSLFSVALLYGATAKERSDF